MSDLRHVWRTATLFVIGLVLELLICVNHTQAGEFDSSILASSTAFQITSPEFRVASPLLQLASLSPFESFQEAPAHRSTQPFGMDASAPLKGGLHNKWSAVKKMLPREHKALMRCRADAGTCTPAAKRFLAVLDKALTSEGWARIGEINRSINLNIKPVDDAAQYGATDLWATPLMAFASNAGDCEDYAIAKYVALHEIGFAEKNLRLVVIHDRATNEDHAVTAVRYEDHWHILDNRTLTIRQDISIAEFNPLFVIDSDGVKRMTKLTPKLQGIAARATPASTKGEFSSAWQNARPLMYSLKDPNSNMLVDADPPISLGSPYFNILLRAEGRV